MANQLETQRSINRLLKQRSKYLQDQNELMTQQLNLAAGIQKISFAQGPKEVNDIVDQTNEKLKELAERFGAAGDAGEVMANKVAKAMLKAKTPSEAIKASLDHLEKKFPKTTAAALGFIDGIVSGFRFVTNVLKSSLGLIESIGKAFLDISASIVAMPFKALDGLVAVANKLAPLMESIARATEEVRKQFGDISKGPAQDVLKAAENVGNQFESMGLGGFRIFGSLDERIQAVNRVATAMGATFEGFSAEFKQASGGILLLQKGLGLTDENMKGIGLRAKATGTSMQTQMQRMTKFSVDFSKRFGVAQKFISRDMGIMTDDVEHFGIMSQKEMALASTYTRKLGLDVKDLVGVVSKFETFESAAESAAMLSQAFGAFIDPIKMMKEQNPAKQVDELRKAFLATGRSADQLSKQERKLLSQQTGLSEQNLATAFSQKNIGVSMQELEKQGKITEERQLTTAEAVREVQNSIERLIKPFKQFTGFLQAFADGFARGVFAGKGFRAMLTAIYNALRETYRIGMQVGKAFDEVFPGVEKLTGTFQELFKVNKRTNEATGRFADLLKDVKASFVSFFREIQGGPKAVEDLFTNLSTSFKRWLGISDEGKKGAKDFAAAVGNTVAGIANVVAKQITAVIEQVTAFLSGDEKIRIPKDGGGIVGAFFNPIIKAFRDENGPIRKVWPAFKKMLQVFWKRHGEDIKAVLKPIVEDIAGFIFGVGLVKAAGAVMAKALGDILVGSIKKRFLGQAAKVGAEAGTSMAESAAAASAEASAAAVGGEAAVATAAEASAAAAGEAAGGGFVSAFMGVLTGPIGIATVVIAVLAAVGGILTKVLAYFEAPFHEFFSSVWGMVVESAEDAFASFGKMISAFFSGDNAEITGSAEDFGEKLVTFVENAAMEAVLAIPMMVEATLGLVYKAFIGFGAFIDRTLSLIGGLILGIVIRLGKDIYEGLAMAGKGIVSALTQPFTDAINWIRRTFRMHSPSGLMEEFGMSIVDGIKEGIKSLSNVITGMMDDVIGGVKKGLGKITGVFGDAASKGLDMFKGVWGVRSPSTEAQSIGTNILDGLMRSMEQIPGEMQRVASKGVSTLSSVLDAGPMAKVAQRFTSPAVDVIKGMIEEANTLTDGLSNLDVINLETKLKNLADKLGVDGEKFRVKQGQVNININLDVTIEADKLAKVLSEHVVSTEKSTR